MLPTLYDWSVEHIRRVFEAKSEAECLRALDDTFARDGEFASNGRTLGRKDLQRFVLAMVAASGFRLRVQWMHALEVPTDDSNRNGVLGGYYIIHNARKMSAGGVPLPGRVARHKFVNVVIESTSDDSEEDSRRIVNLNITASDKPM